MEGRHLGSYRITSLLGKGGMGEVYRAFDERLQRDIAIKVLPASDAHDPAAAARLIREARAAAALNHPNVCTIHEVGEDEGRAFIAMELVEGVALHNAVPPGTGLATELVLNYGTQIADALAHAHERGVLHRDLKTSNIMLAAPSRVKVLDFGLAKRVVAGEDVPTVTTHALTMAGTHAGTPAYMSPEQLRGLPADARSDVWALGVVLYELASGARPFVGQTLFELSSAILGEQPRPLPAHVMPSVRAVIERCLLKEPDARFQTADEVRSALDAARAGVSPGPTSSAVADTKAASPGPISAWRRSSRVAAGAMAIVIVVTGIALNVGGLRDRLWSSQPLYDSVAVLPLENLSGDQAQAYLAGGLHERLTNDLAKLQGFTKVIGSNSARRVRNSTATPVEIARTLGVRALITGSVGRTGDRVTITAQLLDGSDGRTVWGESYERPAADVAGLQNDVVSAIAQAIHLRLRPEDRERLASRATVNPETYELYLRGMHELTSADEGGTPAAGIAYLQKAVDRDPGDPYAYAGLARGYVAVGHSPAAQPDSWSRARTAAERALTLAPDLAEAHSAMGQVKMYYEWDWDGAERAFRRANELNPNMAAAHYHYAWQLFLVDRLDEAIAEHERARDLDPLAPRNTAYLSVLYTAAGRYDDAITASKQVLELNPRNGLGWEGLAFAYSMMGKHDEAIEASRKTAEYAPPRTFSLGIAYAMAGRIDEARAIIETIRKRPPTSYNMWARAMVHMYLGDRDEFFTAIAHEPHHAFVPWVRVEPAMLRLKDDPRYAQLFARFKLPPPTR
jgi:serine/threonine protein kinase/tetratricopeptide (TPR) repeat protein